MAHILKLIAELTLRNRRTGAPALESAAIDIDTKKRRGQVLLEHGMTCTNAAFYLVGQKDYVKVPNLGTFVEHPTTRDRFSFNMVGQNVVAVSYQPPAQQEAVPAQERKEAAPQPYLAASASAAGK